MYCYNVQGEIIIIQPYRDISGFLVDQFNNICQYFTHY